MRQYGEERRANTFSGSTDNLANGTSTMQSYIPATPTTEACQVTSTEHNDSDLMMHPVLLSRPRPSKSISQHQPSEHELSGSLQSSLGHMQQPTNQQQPKANLPLNNATRNDTGVGYNYASASFQSEPYRKMSVPFTQESSSANSSMIEMRAHSPSKWSTTHHNRSDLSSGNVSFSSHDDFLASKAATIPQQHQNNQQWYLMSDSNSSLPTARYAVNPNTNSIASIPRHMPIQHLPFTGARPMGRSMSQEYYHTPLHARGMGFRRCNTFTPADVGHHPAAMRCVCQNCGNSSCIHCVGCSHTQVVPAQMYHHSARNSPSCPCYCAHQRSANCAHCGAIQSELSESYELVQVLPTSSNNACVASGASGGGTGDVGWGSSTPDSRGKEDNHFAMKTEKCKLENFANNKKYLPSSTEGMLNGGAQNGVSNLDIHPSETRPHHVVNTAANFSSEQMPRTKQHVVHDSHSLRRHRPVVSDQQATLNSAQSLQTVPPRPSANGYSGSADFKPRPRSHSAGNVRAVSNSNRSSSSTNTPSSSAGMLPVSSPPLNRNHGE